MDTSAADGESLAHWTGGAKFESLASQEAKFMKINTEIGTHGARLTYPMKYVVDGRVQEDKRRFTPAGLDVQELFIIRDCAAKVLELPLVQTLLAKAEVCRIPDGLKTMYTWYIVLATFEHTGEKVKWPFRAYKGAKLLVGDAAYVACREALWILEWYRSKPLWDATVSEILAPTLLTASEAPEAPGCAWCAPYECHH